MTVVNSILRSGSYTNEGKKLKKNTRGDYDGDNKCNGQDELNHHSKVYATTKHREF